MARKNKQKTGDGEKVDGGFDARKLSLYIYNSDKERKRDRENINTKWGREGKKEICKREKQRQKDNNNKKTKRIQKHEEKKQCQNFTKISPHKKKERKKKENLALVLFIYCCLPFFCRRRCLREEASSLRVATWALKMAFSFSR